MLGLCGLERSLPLDKFHPHSKLGAGSFGREGWLPVWGAGAMQRVGAG